MATTTWKVDNIEVKPQVDGLTDVVYNVHWRVYAQESDTVISIYGVIQVSPPTNGFIPFEDLDEATVLDWVYAEMGADTVQATEANALAQLAAVLAPAVVNKPLPWA